MENKDFKETLIYFCLKNTSWLLVLLFMLILMGVYYSVIMASFILIVTLGGMWGYFFDAYRTKPDFNEFIDDTFGKKVKLKNRKDLIEYVNNRILDYPQNIYLVTKAGFFLLSGCIMYLGLDAVIPNQRFIITILTVCIIFAQICMLAFIKEARGSKILYIAAYMFLLIITVNFNFLHFFNHIQKESYREARLNEAETLINILKRDTKGQLEGLITSKEQADTIYNENKIEIEKIERKINNKETERKEVEKDSLKQNSASTKKIDKDISKLEEDKDKLGGNLPARLDPIIQSLRKYQDKFAIADTTLNNLLENNKDMSDYEFREKFKKLAEITHFPDNELMRTKRDTTILLAIEMKNKTIRNTISRYSNLLFQKLLSKMEAAFLLFTMGDRFLRNKQTKPQSIGEESGPSPTEDDTYSKINNLTVLYTLSISIFIDAAPLLMTLLFVWHSKRNKKTGYVT